MDVMLDLETYGKRPGCVIRSIGAAMFNLSSGVGAEFYANIEHSSCIEVGLHVDPETAMWWKKQSTEAQTSLLVNPQPLKEVLTSFKKWFTDNAGEKVWSQGANFDEPIIAAAFHACGMHTPWRFWNARDTRTLYDIFKLDARTVPRTGTYHNALDDARYQIRCCQIAYAKNKPSMVIPPGIGLPKDEQVATVESRGFLEKHILVTGKAMPWD